jgi:hypothetical protein
MKNKIPLNFRLMSEELLPPGGFYGTQAQCVFQIWGRTEEVREVTKFVRKHRDFEFLRPGDASAPFCMRSVGSLSSVGRICSVAVANKAPRSFH